MNGINYFFDTNAVIALLKGNRSLEKEITRADWLKLSAVRIIGFLSFPGIAAQDINSLKIFAGRIAIVDIPSDFALLHDIADFKKKNRLKLPDAITGFYAIQHKATRITNDKLFFQFPICCTDL